MKKGNQPQLPPHDEESEKALLGCMLLAADGCLPEIQKTGISKASFYTLQHRAVFGAITNLASAGKPVDIVTVQAALRESNTLNEAGGLAYLASLPDCTPGANAFESYADAVRRFEHRRLLIKLGSDCQTIANSEALSATQLSNEIEIICAAIQRKAGSLGGQTLSVRRPDDLLSMEFDASDNMLADRVLAKGQFMTLLGPGGIGKSRLAIQLAISSITGRNFVGLETHGTNQSWLFVQTENNCRRLQSDLRNFKKWAGENWATVNERLHFHTVESDCDSYLPLNDSGAFNRIRQLIRDIKPGVVVFDPLRDFGVGDLNSDADMGETCQSIARLVRDGDPNRACIVLHHSLTGKIGASKANGFDRGSFGRNSKVLQGWTRGQINVAPASAEDNTRLIVACGKNSNGREFPPFGIKLNPDTMVYEVDPSFDLKAWEGEVSGKTSTPILSAEKVAELCDGSLTKAKLVKLVRTETGCSQAFAYRVLDKAADRKLIVRNPIDKTYARR